jgi:hypothetical protein
MVKKSGQSDNLSPRYGPGNGRVQSLAMRFGVVRNAILIIDFVENMFFGFKKIHLIRWYWFGVEKITLVRARDKGGRG